MKKFAIIAAAVLTASTINVHASSKTSPTQFKSFPFLYSVKFLCGLQTVASTQPPIEPAVKPGNYATAVNIHNYHWVETPIFMKAVIADGVIGEIIGGNLKPNQAMNIDCREIVKLSQLPSPLPPFIEGFVEISSLKQLSVAAAYTSQTCINPENKCSALGPLSLDVEPQYAFRDQ